MSYPLRLNDSPPWNALPVEFLQKGSHATWQRKRLNPSLHPDFLGPTWPPLVCFPTLCKEELLLLPWRPIRHSMISVIRVLDTLLSRTKFARSRTAPCRIKRSKWGTTTPPTVSLQQQADCDRNHHCDEYRPDQHRSLPNRQPTSQPRPNHLANDHRTCAIPSDLPCKQKNRERNQVAHQIQNLRGRRRRHEFKSLPRHPSHRPKSSRSGAKESVVKTKHSPSDHTKSSATRPFLWRALKGDASGALTASRLNRDVVRSRQHTC